MNLIHHGIIFLKTMKLTHSQVAFRTSYRILFVLKKEIFQPVYKK